MIYVAAIAAAAVLLVGGTRLSLWVTDRKSSALLATARPDGSDSNGEGWPAYDPTGIAGGSD